MTNIMIVAMEEARLIKEGKMQPHEELHTFQGWKSRGYKIIKGEHAIAKFAIWKAVTNKDDEDVHMIMKNSCWFSTSQVKEA